MKKPDASIHNLPLKVPPLALAADCKAPSNTSELVCEAELTGEEKDTLTDMWSEEGAGLTTSRRVHNGVDGGKVNKFNGVIGAYLIGSTFTRGSGSH